MFVVIIINTVTIINIIKRVNRLQNVCMGFGLDFGISATLEIIFFKR